MTVPQKITKHTSFQMKQRADAQARFHPCLDPIVVLCLSKHFHHEKSKFDRPDNLPSKRIDYPAT